MLLEGKAAVITGGAGNLGTAVTRRFLDEGARVLVPWYNEQSWNRLSQELSEAQAGRCIGTQADMTDEQQVAEVMQLAVDEFGGLDVLLNLVGGFAFGEKVWDQELSTWERMMALNLKSAFLCSKHALRHMRQAGAGRIVNVSSKAALDLQPGASAYAVSKAGLITFTRALREELKGTGISVNAIMPSIMDTPVTRELMPDADHAKWVQPEEVADVLAALCSDRMHAASGSVIRIFGGV